MKKKGIIISLIVVVLLIISIKPVSAYFEYKQEEKRLSQKPYFTEYMLSRDELGTMVRKYYVDENPDFHNPFDEEDWPDYSYYTMKATEDTEMVVTVLNYCLFDNLREVDLAGREKAEEYGFSEEKRITVDWVMSHPKEAVEIMHSMWENGDIFDDYQDVKKIYDEINGVSALDATEQIDESTEQD